jgi:hypothetical protein
MQRHVRAIPLWLGLGIAIFVASVFENALASSTLTSVQTESTGISRLSARALPVPDAGSSRVRGTIILHDSVTGRDMAWPCMTTLENALPDDLVVDGSAWADVAVALCA